MQKQINNCLSQNKLLCPKGSQICSYLEILQSFLFYAQSKIYDTGMNKNLKCRSTFFPLSVLYFHNTQLHHKVQTFGFSTGPKHIHTHCMEPKHATWQNVIMLMQFWIQRVYSLQEKECCYLTKMGLQL